MHFNKRCAHALVLVSTLLLAGAQDFSCSTNKVDDSSGGNAGVGNGAGNGAGNGIGTAPGTGTAIRIRVVDEQKISAESGLFNGNLNNGDQFGSAIADPGDLNTDGIRDLAVGAPFDSDNGSNRGAAWVLFLNNIGLVIRQQEIADNVGGFRGSTNNDDLFGSAIASIADLDADGTVDMVVGAPGSDEGGTDKGAIWVLFMGNNTGRVRLQQNIAEGVGGFRGRLDNDDRFGSAIADIGDINGDGIRDLAVGAPNDDDGSDNAGAVWILFMETTGRVGSFQKISLDQGQFNGNVNANDRFGSAIAGIGDLDNDGVPDLAVGAPLADEGGTDRGAVWILFLEATGRVRQALNIADGIIGGFDGNLNDDDRFGSAVADIGDLDGDGIRDLAIGAPNDDDGSDNAGAVWVLTMQATGAVGSWQKISANTGGFNGNLNTNDYFGTAIAGVGDLDNDGIPDLAVGSPGDNDGGTDRGALWLLFMDR